MSCNPISGRGVMPGWGCCACRAKGGYATYNGEQRTVCKFCKHPRCDGASSKVPGAASRAARPRPGTSS